MAIPVDPFGRASPAPPPSASISPARSPQVTISPPREAPSPADPLPRDGAPPATTTPGGTLLVPSAGHGHTGTKTPRRVQWTSDSHIVSMHPIPPVPGSPSGTLDESNIDEVKAALESHRKNPNRRRPPSMIGGESSGDDDARAGTDEDYDYRLDVDPPAPDLETSVRPVPEHTDFQNILDNGMDEHVTGYIPFGETDGLPNIQQTEAKDELGEAKNIVRAHSGKWGVLRRRVRGAGAVNRAFAHRTTSQDPEKAEGDFVAFASRYPEPRRRTEREGHSPMGHAGMLPIPGGASVLSSLLALYGQQNLPSGTTSGATSRASSENGSSDDEDKRRHVANDSHRHVSADDEPHDPYNLNSPVEVMAPNESHLKAGIHRGFGTSFNSKSASSLVGHPPPSPGFLDLIHKAKEQIHDKDRPKAARSGAGVFGALVQNTSSLSGAATPAGAALAPAAKRPGYQLSRYSLPDATASAPSTQPWRPDYRSGSRPASVRSSTAVSRDGESPKGDQPFTKTVSSDDMLSMRTENIRPKHHTLESLGRLSGRALKEGGQALKQTEKWILSGGKTQLITPPDMATNEYFARPLTEDERRRREWEAEKKNRKQQKEARKKQEIFVRSPRCLPLDQH